jgi:molybdopterin-guanine dinucleotide biosynthesis protein A
MAGSPGNELTLVIQAGGRSSRMGGDKALKPFLGQPLIQRVIECLSSIASETMVTTNNPEALAFLKVRLVPDILPERGALGGLYTAFACASSPLVAVAACDMPFASPAIFQLAARLLVEEGVDAVVPHPEGGLEPLHAVYRRSTCLPVVRRAVEAGQLKAIDWFNEVRLRELSPEEVRAVDPSGLTFWNINTPEDLQAAEKAAREMEPDAKNH